MLEIDDITTNPKMYTWSPSGSKSPAITVNTTGTYMCTVSNDCGNDTATTTVTSKFCFISSTIFIFDLSR